MAENANVIYRCEKCAKLHETKKNAQQCCDGLTPLQRLADTLHGMYCNSPYEDVCGYFYASWENPNSERESWLRSATALSGKAKKYGLTIEAALEIVKASWRK